MIKPGAALLMVKIWKRLLSIFVVFIVIIIISELFLLAVSLTFSKVGALLSREELKLDISLPDKRLGHRPNPDYPGHDDSKGFRNDHVPVKADVVALGDSQTYGSGVKRELAWPQCLANMGNLEVYNFGFGGYGPVHSLILMDEALAIKPKIIVEAFYSGNDLYDAYSMVYYRGSNREMRTRDQSVLKDCERAEQAKPMREEIHEVHRLHLEENEEETHNVLREFVAGHSRLYGLIRALKRRHSKSQHERDLKYDWDKIKEDLKHGGDKIIFFDGGNIKTVFEPRYRFLALDQENPRISEGLRLSLLLIKKMNEKAREKGVNFIVLLLPTKELVFKDVVYERLKDIPEIYRELMENEELIWKKTKKFLKDERINYVDSLPVLREALLGGNQPYWLGLDGHPNKVGYEAVARLLLSEIGKRNFLHSTPVP